MALDERWERGRPVRLFLWHRRLACARWILVIARRCLRPRLTLRTRTRLHLHTGGVRARPRRGFGLFPRRFCCIRAGGQRIGFTPGLSRRPALQRRELRIAAAGREVGRVRAARTGGLKHEPHGREHGRDQDNAGNDGCVAHGGIVATGATWTDGFNREVRCSDPWHSRPANESRWSPTSGDGRMPSKLMRWKRMPLLSSAVSENRAVSRPVRLLALLLWCRLPAS